MIAGMRRGGSTVAVVALDTAVNESRKKMAASVTRSPGRFCSRDGKLYHGRLEYDFHAFCLASYLSYFLLAQPGMFLFFVLLRLCSSHLLLSSKYSSTCCCVIRILPHVIIPFVFILIDFPN